MSVTDTHVIGDYTAAATIDGSTHYLLIQPGSASTAYKKINRAVLLGVNGQPVDISTVQTLTNKIIGITNTVTIADNLFTIQDNSDNTKQAQFQLSGITTGITRTYTLPNASSTLVDIATTQTLAGKTLTSPTINGGTIDNATVTVDSIAGHTDSDSGTVYGISVTNGAIQSSTAFKDGIILPKALQSGTGLSWDWQSWTPTWTNLTVGDATQRARYIQQGKTVFFAIDLILGAASVVSNNPQFTFPVALSSNYEVGDPNGALVANLWFLDAGTAEYPGAIRAISTSVGLLNVYGAAATYVNFQAVTASIPFVFATGDKIFITGCYETA